MKKTMKNAISSLTAKLAALLLLALGCAGSAWALTGTGTSTDPFQIATLADLQEFREAVNGGTTYAGQYVKLTADIDLSAVDNWTPIGEGTRKGVGNCFAGTFDGNSKTISGLKISSYSKGTDYAVGLFGLVKGGTVKDFAMTAVDIAVGESQYAVGSAVGAVYGSGMVSGVSVTGGSVTGGKGVGGVVGMVTNGGTVSGCSNAATVKALTYNSGGVVGSAYCTTATTAPAVENCSNSGSVSGKTGVGGVVGLSSADITGCSNTASVTGNGTSIGGVIGEQKSYGTVSGNTNSGNVTNNGGGYGTGGIIGWIRYQNDSSYVQCTRISVQDNTNSGSVSGGNDAGGIVGTVYHTALVSGNTNKAESLSGTGFAAGIVGNYQIGDAGATHEPADNTDVLTMTGNTSETAAANITANCTGNIVYDNSTGANSIIVGNTPSNQDKANVVASATVNGVTTAYASLMEAINAAYNGGTVEVLADVTVEHWHQNIWTLVEEEGDFNTSPRQREPLVGPNNLTIHGNGHTLTVNAIDSAGNGNRLFSGAKNLNIDNYTIDVKDGAGIGMDSGMLDTVSIKTPNGNTLLPGANCTSAADYSADIAGVTVKNCTLDGGTGSPFYVNENGRAANFKISGSTLKSTSTGTIAILRGNEVLEDCTIESPAGSKITLTNGGVAGPATITGNNFGETGLKIYSANNCEDATIAGNVFSSASVIKRDGTDVVNLSENYWGDGSAPSFTDSQYVVVDSYYQNYDTATGTLSNLYEVPPVATVTINETTTKYTDLNKALTAAVTAGQDATVTICAENLENKTLDLSGSAWSPVSLNANNGGKFVTVEGSGAILTGLSDMLFSGTWAGKTGLVIKDLTIKDSTIVHDAADAEGDVGVGAFIGWPQATETVTLSNCHLVNSKVEGGHWTGGLIGIAAGYSGNDGPVFETVTITGCSVENSTITGKGSAGGIIGHGAASDWTKVIITDTTVTGNTVKSTGSSGDKAGAVCGTVGAAGQEKTVNGVTHEGGIELSADVSNNTVTSGTTDKGGSILGRIGSKGGELAVTGGSYDGTATYANDTYDSNLGKIIISGGSFKTAPSADAVADGFVVTGTPNAEGYYTLEEYFAAQVGETKYKTLAEAIYAAYNGGTVTLLDDITVSDWEQNVYGLQGTSAGSAAGPNGLVIDGAGHTLTVSSLTQNSINNGGHLLYKGNFTVKNLTVNLPTGATAFAPQGGLFENVTFNGGKRAMNLQYTTDTVAIEGCTFKNTSGNVFYTEGGTKVAVNDSTFESANLSINGAWSFTSNTVKNASADFGSTNVTFKDNDLSEATVGLWADNVDLSENYWGAAGDYESKVAANNRSYSVDSLYTAISKDESGSIQLLSNLAYKVKFVNFDGSTLFATNVVPGGVASYEGATPAKPGDETSAYAFSGWDPATIVAVTDAPQTYTAQFAAATAVAAVFELADGGATTNNYASYADLHAALEAGKAAGKTVALLADIDLAGVAWTPVGTTASPFYGSIDGNGKTISNLTINDPTLDYAGLIGYGNGGTPAQVIKDLTISNATITARMYVGVLGGCLYANNSINNVTVKGLIQVTGNYMVGGVVGQSYIHAYDSAIVGDEGSFVKGLYLGGKNEVVDGMTLPDDCEGDNVGGFIGHMGEGSALGLFNCSASGLTVMGTRKVGGLVGTIPPENHLENVSVSGVTIGTTADAAYATAKKSSMEIGGVVGSYYNNGTGGVISGTVQDVTIAELPTGVTGTGDGKNISYGLVTGGNRGADPASKLDYSALIAKGYDAAKYNNSYLINNYVAVVTDAEGNFVGGYETVDDALKAAKTSEGATVNIFAGSYTLTTTSYTFADGVTVIGETDSEGNNLVTFNNKELKFVAKDFTLKNVNIVAPSGSALHYAKTTGLFEHVNITSPGNGIRECQIFPDGTMTFKDCNIHAGTYGIHYDTGTGSTINIIGGSISGWNSFGSVVKQVNIIGTEFPLGTSYNQLRFYQDAVISNATFNGSMNLDFGQNGESMILSDCVMADGSDVKDHIRASDLANENRYVAVGNGVVLDEDGKIVGGVFEIIDDETIADGYISIDNPDSATSANYPLTVGGPYKAVFVDADGKVKNGFGTLKEAFEAVNSSLDDTVNIRILSDIETSEWTSGANLIFSKNLTIDAYGTDPVTVNLQNLNPLVGSGKTMEIGEKVVISRTGQFGSYAGSSVVLNGDVGAFQWYLYQGTVTVNPCSTNTLGFGDGQVGMWGDVAINVQGAMEDAAHVDISTITPQVSGGYVKYFWGNQSISLKDTFVSTTWVVGDNRYSNYEFGLSLDNSILQLTGSGDKTFNFLGQSTGTISLKGSRIIANGGTVAINASDTVNMDWKSSITAKNFTNTGKIVLDMAGFDGTFPLTLVSTTDAAAQLGDFEVINNTSGATLMLDANGNIVAVEAVAQIGDEQYGTLEAAIAAAQADDTVKLLKDVAVNTQINLPVPVTIDLNGKTITSAADNRVFKIATAVGEYMFKNGTVNTTNPCYGLFRVDNASTVTVEGITTTNDRSWGCNFRIAGGAQVLVTNCTITATNGGGVYAEGGSTVNVYDSTIAETGTATDCNASAFAIGEGATLTVHNGTYSGEYGAFVCSSGGTIEILDGSVTGRRYAIESDARAGGNEDNSIADSLIKISGGTIDGQLHEEIQLYNSATLTYANKMLITGGTFLNYSATGPTADNAGYEISGGLFDHQVLAAHCAEGYSPTTTPDANGMYTVISDFEAQIVRNGEVILPKGTLAEMIAGAQDGDTVQLLKDVTASDFHMITKSITFDGAGYTVTSSAKRVFRISAPNISVAFKDMGIVCANTGTDTRGINVDKAVTDSTVSLDGCSVSAKYYPINLTGGTGVTIAATNSTVTGWCALNSGSTDATVTFKGCTLNSHNFVGSNAGGNAFAAIVLNYDGVNVSLEDTTVNITTDGAYQSLACLGQNIYSSAADTVITIDDGCVLNLGEGNTYPLINFDVRVSTIEVEGATLKAQFEAAGYGMKGVEGKDGWYTPFYPVAEIDGTFYETLAAAIDAAQDGDTVKLLSNCSGSGIVVPQNKFGTNGLTVDFNNFTYTVNNDPLAGSTGTKNQAFQLLKGNKVTFKDGAIVADNAGVKMLIQNYADLTLDNMTLDATQGNNSVGYVLSTNNGSTTIKDTTIVAKENGVAFDACSGWGGYASNEITVTGTSAITGDIEVSFYGQENTSAPTVNLNSGTHTGAIKVAQGFGEATVYKTSEFNQEPPADYKWVETETSGVYQLVPKVYVVQNVNTEVKYETLAEAFAAANTGDTVKLLADITYGTDKEVDVFTKAVNLDLGGFTLKTQSTVSTTEGNNGYKAAAVCYSIEGSDVKKVTVSNGSIETAYGAGVYADGLGLELTLANLTIRAATVGTQTTKEYSSAVRITGNAKVVIANGTYTGPNAIAVSNSGGRYVINGGDFDGDLYISTYANSGVAQTVEIADGKFKGNFVKGSGEFAISGGVFSVQPDASYPASGYVVVDNADAATKDAYPYTVAETIAQFVYPIEGTAGLPIPSDWLAANSVAGYSDAEQPILATMTNAMVTALSGKADNGMPMWQSYVLGLTPNGANATALRLAATAKDATTVTITAAVNVPATLENSGTTVSFRLVEQNADGTWTDIEAGKASPSFDVSLDTVAGKVLTIFADIVTK